jgi:uncharacterized protein
MHVRHIERHLCAIMMAFFVISVPLSAAEERPIQIKGEVKEVHLDKGQMIIRDSATKSDVTVSLSALTSPTATLGKKKIDLNDLKPGAKVIIGEGVVASSISIDESQSKKTGTILEDFWHNFTHNLFKPLLLFFYLGFLVPILKVEFEFPYAMYQALTIFLLLAIGWHGGEELAKINATHIGGVVGFMFLGFFTNSVIGVLAYILLTLFTKMRRVDKATVAGYYGSDSAGTFATCVGVLGTAAINYDAYMPVMLAVLEVPGCLVAIYLVSRLRHTGMDALGNMPDEPGYNIDAKPIGTILGVHVASDDPAYDAGVEAELEIALERREHPEPTSNDVSKKKGLVDKKLLHEVFLNPGLYLLFGGILIGFLSGLQGAAVTRDDDNFFVSLFQGVLCLFLLEMGMTASRKLKDLKAAGAGFIAFGILAPNLFATIGICSAHAYAVCTGTEFELGTYVLFSVLCGAASYIAVPAVQRLAIPEASPTLPLAASLGLTFSYNVTIGISIYIEIAKVLVRMFPVK